MSDPRLCLAVDVPTGVQAIELVKATAHVFGVFKIGLELFCSEGPSVVARLKLAGAERIFVDLKLHDIPRTVAGAVRRITALGADYLTIHTAGGLAMMESAQAAADGRVRLLGVTVLTSLDQRALTDAGTSMAISELVLQRGRLARQARLAGLVCSPNEVQLMRAQLGQDIDLVTPGIRFQGQATQDQKRVLDPGAALNQGATLLVIGRAVTEATCLETALVRLRESVSL